jgi:Metal binding domain of Ada
MSRRFIADNRTRHAFWSKVVGLAFFLLLAESVPAQDTECKVKLSELPQAAEFSGFRIGMTRDQVKARVPQVVFGRTDDLGTSKTSINPFYDSRIDKTGFADVRTISLDFLDGRVTSLWIGYDPTFKWPTVAEFVKGISQSLSLPDAWSPWKSQGQQMKCADFRLTVSIVARGPSFRILDLTADATLTARRFAKEEESEALAENNAEEAEIVGDKQTKIYYPFDCELAKEISKENRTTFRTAQEAEQAGYKPAKECK